MAEVAFGVSRSTSTICSWSHGGFRSGRRLQLQVQPLNRITFTVGNSAVAAAASSDRSSLLSLSVGLGYLGNRLSQRHLCAAVASSDSKASILSNVDANLPDLDLDTIGGAGDGFGDRSGDGGGGGGGGGGDGNGGSSDDNKGEEGPDGDEKKTGLSMSQKLTLGYAALVGAGGVMGFLKSGSQKSLLAGGFSAALLYYVFTELPVRPVFASSLGLGISAALLVVMGSRFKRSGKVFPAGVVSLVSFVMTGGYFHGILRSVH
ncbi:protein FATTY ACID EXPORT 2, chloroplastic [Senna tora]|uniref:Protein FATTY ACID EXPORT 2, chloroplastic n=1 Tax=Senna tora TaxID=362788 RepID=A0A834X4I3_9FABA|nr:protein FATTY ACID EXPORT 2, chloroplastic [Senna tora]